MIYPFTVDTFLYPDFFDQMPSYLFY